MAAQTFTQDFGYRLGCRAMRAARGYLRYERKAAGWLADQGVPAALITPLLWSIKLALLGALLYVAFWLAMLAAFAGAVVWAAPYIDWDDDEQREWRYGYFGFGLYHPDGSRIDPYDPDEET